MTTLLGFSKHGSVSGRFEALMRPFFDDLYRAASRLARNDSDARDLVQEVCIKAFLNFDELEGMRHQRAWLLKVLYHSFVDLKRSEQRSPTRNATVIEDYDEPFLADKQHYQPDEQVDHLLRIEKVLRAMSVLAKDECALLAMHDIDGLSIAELHDMTGLPKGTIKSRLFRTRVKLGRLLQNEQISGPKLRVVGSEK